MDQPATSSRPRGNSRSFSLRSDKSNGSKNKLDHAESPNEKRRRDSLWKNGTKANPNAAMNEAQPGEANLTEKVTIDSIRGYQHKDSHGNVITDPDLSNPTRPRLERPLDTIRSFEKAIDRGYSVRETKRRESYVEPTNPGSRTPSYYGGSGFENGNRYSQVGSGGYYGGSSRPDSYAEPRSQRSRYGSRTQSDGMRSNNGGYSPQHNYNQSHDTVMTGGSDSTGPWANSTDPSSENSSLDRINATTKPHNGQYDNGSYGSHGFKGPIMEEQGQGGYYGGGGANGGPVQSPEAPRKPISLGNTTSSLPPATQLPTVGRPEQEKRKSWFKRLGKKD